MITHIGTNDATSSTTKEIQDNLLKLKPLVNKKLPQRTFWLSTPTLRTHNGKATLTVSQLVNHLLTLLWRRPLSCRNQPIDLWSKSMEWSLYNNGLRHERLNFNIDIIDNRDIKNRHLSRKVLHLNDSRSKLLARIFLEKGKSF